MTVLPKEAGNPTERLDVSLREKAPQDPLLGELIDGRYRINRLLNAGGMGVVYLALHERIQKEVAFKVLLPELAQNEQAVARFQREAKAACRLDQQNCVRVTDFGLLPDSRLYLVMDYVNGGDLASRIRKKGKLTVRDAVELTIQICKGLEEAHEMGIVHRDLKPENIMLAQRRHEEVVKILDFGIAKICEPGPEEPQHLTKTGMVFGTPAYLSPEQALGGAIDARTDIYATGVILYQMLSGHLPFESATPMGLLGKHLNEAPPLLSSAVEDLPGELEEIVAKCLEKRPENRFASAMEMRKRLERFYLRWVEGVGNTAIIEKAPAPPKEQPTANILQRSLDAILNAFDRFTFVLEHKVGVWVERKVPRLKALLLGRVLALTSLGVVLLLFSWGVHWLASGSPLSEEASLQPVVVGSVDGGTVGKETVGGEVQDETARLLGEIRVMIGQGKLDEALVRLRQMGGANPRDGRINLLFGIACSVRGMVKDSYQAFNLALDLDPSLSRNEDLLARMVDELGGKSYKKAMSFIEKRLRHDAVDTLVAATADRRSNVRHRAAELLEKLGRRFRVDFAQIYGMDLAGSTSPKEVKKNLKKVDKLGDTTALKYLYITREKWQDSSVVEDIDELITQWGGKLDGGMVLDGGPGGL